MAKKEKNIPEILQQAKDELAYTPQQLQMWQAFDVVLRDLVSVKAQPIKRMRTPVDFIYLP